MKHLMATAALVFSSALATTAGAQAYNLNYGSAGTPGSARIGITTSGTANPDGSFTILSASGTVDGNAITGLIANPNQPDPATSADNLFIYDNNFFTSAPALDNNGLFFSVGATEYNFFSTSPTSFTLYSATGGQYGANSVGTLSVAAVPEPATWAMMLVGFGMIGFGLRRRAKPTMRVTYA